MLFITYKQTLFKPNWQNTFLKRTRYSLILVSIPFHSIPVKTQKQLSALIWAETIPYNTENVSNYWFIENCFEISEKMISSIFLHCNFSPYLIVMQRQEENQPGKNNTCQLWIHILQNTSKIQNINNIITKHNNKTQWKHKNSFQL